MRTLSAPGTAVSTRTTSSSCRNSSGSIATHQSSGVELSVPSTLPIGWLSFSDICLPERDFEGTAKQLSVAQPMTEHSLELTNRIEILRSASVTSNGGGEARHHRCRHVRKLACVCEP